MPITVTTTASTILHTMYATASLAGLVRIAEVVFLPPIYTLHISIYQLWYLVKNAMAVSFDQNVVLFNHSKAVNHILVKMRNS